MKLNRLISVAPMMGCTDRHARYLFRLIAPDVLLYTEMVTTQALLHGDSQRFLAFHPLEHPVALQLGGSDPKQLACCAKMGENFGYDEINLNVGCPSDRVKSGHFGACLMLTPPLVADCVAAMVKNTSLPITVKCRIGVDQQDSYSALSQFIQMVAEAGCRVFIIHARKAWLNGLSPKENREIPPLQYDVVKQIKKDFPDLTIVLNGGIKSLSDIDSHFSDVDGMMIGREVYANPYCLMEIQKKYYDSGEKLSRIEIIERYIPYIESQLKNQIKLATFVRPLLGLFYNQRGGKAWRRYLSEQVHQNNIDVIKEALNYVRFT